MKKNKNMVQYNHGKSFLYNDLSIENILKIFCLVDIIKNGKFCQDEIIHIENLLSTSNVISMSKKVFDDKLEIEMRKIGKMEKNMNKVNLKNTIVK